MPTTSLVEQLFKDFKDYGWSPERNVHRIYQGHDKETAKPVIISTWQSIYNLPKKWFKDVGMIIGDEAHLFKAVSLTKILTKLEKCPYKIGMTGTLDGSKTHKLVLEGLFGAVNKVVSTTELQEKKQLADLKIYSLILKHGVIECKHAHGFNYQEEMDYIVQSDKRNKFIRNLQSIGRGLRLKDNNTHATLYDIADDLTYNEKENYTLSHFRERINIYSEEDFDYEIHNIELNNESTS